MAATSPLHRAPADGGRADSRWMNSSGIRVGTCGRAGARSTYGDIRDVHPFGQLAHHRDPDRARSFMRLLEQQWTGAKLDVPGIRRLPPTNGARAVHPERASTSPSHAAETGKTRRTRCEVSGRCQRVFLAGGGDGYTVLARRHRFARWAVPSTSEALGEVRRRAIFRHSVRRQPGSDSQNAVSRGVQRLGI